MTRTRHTIRRVWFGLVILLFLAMAIAVNFWKGNQESAWRVFKNVQNGYEIRAPSSWIRESAEGAVEVFWSPDRKAYVAVQYIVDPRLLEDGGEEKMIREIRESFKKDPDYELAAFRSRFEKTEPEPATVSGYLAQGRLKLKGDKYLFREYAVQVADEEILAVIRAAIDEGAVEKYKETIEGIVESFDPVAGRREAIGLVEKQKEVREYEERLKKAGSGATFALTDDGDNWLIQVYEIVEQDGEGHSATFNWYRVNKETKKVIKEF